MEQEELIIVDDALADALYLISNEIQCVINEDVYDEYQKAIDKLNCALQIVRKYTTNR